MFESRVLAHILPLRPGAKVLILGEAPLLARSLARRGAAAISGISSTDRAGGSAAVGRVTLAASGEVIPLEEESVDHAIVLSADTHGVPTLVLAEVARVLRRGGGLYFGVPHRWRFVTNPRAWSVARGRRALHEAGFRDVEAYGVRHSVFNLRFLVPLEDSQAVRSFLTSMCVPLSAREAIVVAALVRIPSSRTALALFPDLGFVARRAGGAQAC